MVNPFTAVFFGTVAEPLLAIEHKVNMCFVQYQKSYTTTILTVCDIFY